MDILAKTRQNVMVNLTLTELSSK